MSYCNSIEDFGRCKVIWKRKRSGREVDLKMAEGVPDLAAGAVLASSDEMPEGSEKVLSHQLVRLKAYQVCAFLGAGV